MKNSILIFGRFVRRFWISILVCMAILILCFMKTDELSAAPIPNFDKWVHFMMFMGLSGVVFFDNTWYLRLATSGRRIFFGSFLLIVLFGGLIEIVQGLFISYRSGDWWDFFFDVLGTLTGALICLLINRRLKPVLKSHPLCR